MKKEGLQEKRPDAVELGIDLQLLEAKEEGGVVALQQRLLDVGQPLRQPVPCNTTNHIKENPEIEFLDINLTKDSSFAPCYSQSLLDLKENYSLLWF
jgi:hypothetical protein